MFDKAFLLLVCFSTLSALEVLRCEDEGPYYAKFLPKNYGNVIPGGNMTLTGRCFKQMKISFTETEKEFKLEYFVKDKESWYCNEFLIATSGKTLKTDFALLPGRYYLSWDKSSITPAETSYIQKRGVRILLSCDSTFNWLKDIWMTLKLFVGGMGTNPNIPIFGSKVPEYQLNANIDWIKGYAGYEWVKRENPKTLSIDKNEIKSGTFVAIVRLDGIDQLIHIGSGSRVGHSTIALWDREEDELYILESQDAAYFPTKNIQKTKWDDWVKFAHNADFNVVLFPLNDEYQAKFDEAKAWEWFKEIGGTPYGFHNFLFGWLDDVDNNVPDILDLNFVTNILQVIELVSPDIAHLMFLEAFNMRLGTNHDNISDIWEELYQRDMTLEELVEIVEKEEWSYSDGDKYVCSSFVVSVYRRAGIFGDMQIESTELGPKDLYELAIYDLTGNKIPKGCEEYSKRGYCQIMGKIDFDVGKANFVKPYAHMAEKCPSIAPLYERSEGC